MDIAIDLGTGRTRIYVLNKGKLLDEASVVVREADSGKLIAAGDEAYEMVGKTPFAIESVRPLESGVISHSEAAEDMVNDFLKRVCSAKIIMPRVITSVPCGVTEVEKRAIVNTIISFGVRKVFLIEAPKAAALGCGVDILGAHGTFIANLGAGIAEAAVLSLGGISVYKSTKNSGDKADEEIIKYVRKKYGLIIGKNTAEKCKKEIGCVKLPKEEKVFRLKGRDAVSGLPRYTDVVSSEIAESLAETAMSIVNMIKDVLELTPPELVSDIYSDGIILTGGLARLSGLPRLISEKTHLRIRVHREAPDCVINGCAEAGKYLSGSEINPILASY